MCKKPKNWNPWNPERELILREYNKLHIRIKVHLYGIDDLKKQYPKPTIEEMDKILFMISNFIREK